MNWQPIDTAPTDDTPILTEGGIVKRGTKSNTWFFCDSFGDAFICADEGPYYANPKFWMPLPKAP